MIMNVVIGLILVTELIIRKASTAAVELGTDVTGIGPMGWWEQYPTIQACLPIFR